MMYLAACYVLVLVQEYVQYWYIYLLLSLPPRLFQMYNNTVTLTVDDDEPTRNIWIVRTKLILESYPNQFETEYIAGPQLMLLADEHGCIPFNMLERYYPKLDTLYVQYLDLNPIDIGSDSTITRSSIDGQAIKVVTKIIDIKKRLDIRAGQKCKFGRIQL